MKKLSNYRTFEVILVIVILLVVAFRVAAAAPPAPTGLLTEGKEQPRNDPDLGNAGIENPSPLFEWESSSQAAFQVQLGDASDFNNIIWDSLKKDTTTLSVNYEGGTPLKSNQTYHWRVRIWDEYNSTSSWSDSAMFDMNIFILNRELAPSGSVGVAFAFGDITGSGLRDIVVSAHGDTLGELIVYENTGGGQYDQLWSTDTIVSEAIALADLNSNGYLDLIVLNKKSDLDSLMIFKNNKNGSFSEVLTCVGDGSIAIAAGDINRNGKIDIVEGFYGAQNRLWLNKGNFSFNSYEFGSSNNTYDVTMADLNSSGYLDLIIANSGDNEVYLNKKNESSPFSNTPDWSDGQLSPVTTFAAALTDMEGSGVWDFITAGRQGQDPSSYRYYINSGDGSFSSSATTAESAEAKALTSADINNNGLLDLADGNLDTDMVFLNNGGSFNLSNYAFSNQSTYRSVLADFTGNGTVDILRGVVGANSKFLVQVPTVSYSPPSPPGEGFKGVYNSTTGKLQLQWGPGDPSETSFTPQNQLAYNIRLGTEPGGRGIISGAIGSTDNSGSFWGNIGRSTYVHLNIPSRTYFWSVQAIDGAKNAGPWSDEQVVNTPPQGQWVETVQRDFSWVIDHEPEFNYHDFRRGLADVRFMLKDQEFNDCYLTSFEYSTSSTGQWHLVDDENEALTSPAGENSNWSDNGGNYFSTEGVYSSTETFLWGARLMDYIGTADFESNEMRVRFKAIDIHGATSSWITSDFFYIDNLNPTQPGQLETASYDKNSITFNFGDETFDNNFREYVIFWNTGEGVSHYPSSHIEYIDSLSSGYENLLSSAGYGGASTVTISGLNEDATYYFRIFAYDDFGNYNGAVETVAKTNHAPDIEIYSVEQSTDGSGLVYITFTGADNDEEESFYEWDGCMFWLGSGNYTMQAATSSSVFDNEPLMFGKEVSTYVFVWDAGQQLAEEEFNGDSVSVKPQIKVFDSRDTGSSAINDWVEVDNRPPYIKEQKELEFGAVTSGSIEWIWPEAEEENFDRYELWYSSVSLEAVSERSTNTAVMKELPDNVFSTTYKTESLIPQTRYWGKVWAYDKFGYQDHTSTASRTTGNPPQLWISSQPVALRDGSGYVEFKVKIKDKDEIENQIDVEFSTDGGNSFSTAHIHNAEVEYGDYSINYEQFQVRGIATEYDTNTVRIWWSSKEESENTAGLDGQYHENVILKLTPFDGATHGSTCTAILEIIDNSNPELVLELDNEGNPLSDYEHEEARFSLRFQGQDGESGEFKDATVDTSRVLISTGTGTPKDSIDLAGSTTSFSNDGNYLYLDISDEQRNWIARSDGQSVVPFMKLLSSAAFDNYGNYNLEYSTVEFRRDEEGEEPVLDKLHWYPDETPPEVVSATYAIVGGDMTLTVGFDEYMDALHFREETDFSSLVIQDSTNAPIQSEYLSKEDEIVLLTTEDDSTSLEFYIPYGFHEILDGWQGGDWQGGALFLSISKDRDEAPRDLTRNPINVISTTEAFKIWTDTTAMETPEVIKISPPSLPDEDARDVSLSTNISVGFNEFLIADEAKKSINVRQIEDSLGNEVNNEIAYSSITFNSENCVLLFTPDKLLPGNSLIEVRISKDKIFNFFGDHMKENFIWTFKTRIDKEKANIIKSPSGIVSLDVSGGQFPSDGRIVFTENIPAENPLKSSVEAYYNAVEKEKSWDNPYKYPIEELTFEILFSTTDSENYLDGVSFTENAQMTVHYSTVVDREASAGGIWDYVPSDLQRYRHSPKVNEKTLKIYYLDEANSTWRPLASKVDTGSKTISAPVRHFSVYTVMGGRNYSTDDAYAYPVPYKPSERPAKFEGEPARSGITFTRLPSECEIEIYTPSGRLVNSFSHSDNNLQAEVNEPGIRYWYPVENSKGQPLASGVYIYLIESGGNRKSGKLVVIR